MSVNIRNPITGDLTNASGGVINPKSINEMIAPIEDGTASKAYAVGEQFIMNDLLCEATQAIAQGDTMVIGTNCEESEQLSKQVREINDSLTANGNRFEAGYSSENDEYGFNIGSTFYPIGASSGGGVMVDTALDSTSENPVQNKVITGEINDINSDLAKLSYSSEPDVKVVADGVKTLNTLLAELASSTNFGKVSLLHSKFKANNQIMNFTLQGSGLFDAGCISGNYSYCYRISGGSPEALVCQFGSTTITNIGLTIPSSGTEYGIFY